ncbi:DUF4118 domain-containing protein [Azoarcus sp. TTM-91]|uniref:ATP-binding protein n=1 Tax=Azoarcus sp. TTM-91 TaxID=2691581 RepID=UPI00145CB654|nr:ATP-binding protein [Azoarcus sp. TTM-91]NMG33555.1 DUF4118 domain-containing protein [Azoarcus sp. TTM-91]
MSRSAPTPRRRARAWGVALLASLATVLAAAPLRHLLDPANIAMLFLIVVFFVALRLGRGPAVLTACANVVLLDYVIVPPHFGFIPTDVQYVVTLVVMLTVGLVTAQLADGLRRQATHSALQERETRSLYELARELAGSSNVEQVHAALAAYSARHGRRVTLHLGSREPAPEGNRAYPLEAGDTALGTLYVADSKGDENSPWEESERNAENVRLQAVASLLATALERVHYVQLAQNSQVEIAAERLRNSVLAAVSHDLRTPMTVLIGLADSLQLSREPLPPAAAETSLALLRQARAIGSLLNNVLDMARLHSGKTRLRREWQLFDDVIAASLRLLKPQLAERPVKVRLQPDLPLVELDAVLMERVVCNLIDNAAKYSPAGAPIEIGTYVDEAGGRACIEVCDHGPGFPPGKLARMFELFERGNPESSVPGMGLGLAICQRIVAAHGGEIEVRNRPEGGACVKLWLPLGNPPAIGEE